MPHWCLAIFGRWRSVHQKYNGVSESAIMAISICHHTYLLSFPSAIMPISFCAYQLSSIMPTAIIPIDHHAYLTSCLSAIMLIMSSSIGIPRFWNYSPSFSVLFIKYAVSTNVCLSVHLSISKTLHTAKNQSFHLNTIKITMLTTILATMTFILTTIIIILQPSFNHLSTILQPPTTISICAPFLTPSICQQ